MPPHDICGVSCHVFKAPKDSRLNTTLNSEKFHTLKISLRELETAWSHQIACRYFLLPNLIKNIWYLILNQALIQIILWKLQKLQRTSSYTNLLCSPQTDQHRSCRGESSSIKHIFIPLMFWYRLTLRLWF